MHLDLQKLTLLDYPGEVACTVFSSGCNFRCPFCHNGSLVTSSGTGLPDAEEVMDFLKKRSGILDGVCFTGGEPLLHPEILDFAARAKAMGYKVKLDTNGSFPDRLAGAISSGAVDYVAMDIKNSPEKYAATTGNDTALEQIKRSVELLRSGQIAYEFRTTVTGNLHEPADFAVIGQWISGAPRYFLQPFLASEDVLDKSVDHAVTSDQLEACLAAVKPHVPNAAIRGR